VKLAARILLLALLLAIVVTGLMTDWSLPAITGPAVSTTPEEPIQMGNDPVAYFVYKLFFR